MEVNSSQEITSSFLLSRRRAINIFILFHTIVLFSFLRSTLIVLIPFSTLIFIILFRSRFPKNIYFIIISILLSLIISNLFIEGNIVNNILSLYLIAPPIIIFLSKSNIERHDYLPSFINYSSFILILNNIIGFIQLIIHPTTDDAFIGFYGSHGIGLHSLSIVNYIVGAFYFFKYRFEGRRKYLLMSLFFFSSAILSFYGLGLILFLFTILIFNFSLKRFYRFIIVTPIIIVIFGLCLYVFKPDTYAYNVENLRRFSLIFKTHLSSVEKNSIPRKLLVFRNYLEGFSNNANMILFGSGPGTFNSRSYFLLNSDYSDSKLIKGILGQREPKVAEKYVHPLWNTENTVRHMDGTRNQPFSSLLSVLAEYGVLFFVLLAIVIFNKYNRIVNSLKDSPCNYYVPYLKFLSIFILLNLLTDNLFEYPEIMLVCILIFKLAELTPESSTIRTHDNRIGQYV